MYVWYIIVINQSSRGTTKLDNSLLILLALQALCGSATMKWLFSHGLPLHLQIISDSETSINILAKMYRPDYLVCFIASGVLRT